MIKNTLEQISLIVLDRKIDWSKLNGTAKQQLENYEYFVMKEKSRHSKQKISVLLLKKIKVISPEVKDRILKIVAQIINIFVPVLGQVFLVDEDYSEIGLTEIMKLIHVFEVTVKLPKEKTSTICRPNNAFVIVDFLWLTLQYSRNVLKQVLYQTFPPKQIKLNTHSEYEERMRPSKVKTEADQSPSKQRQYRPYFTDVGLELEQKQLVFQKRKQFIQKFDLEEIAEKLSNHYAQLLALNQKNRGQIKNYLLLAQPKKSFDFAFNEEHKSLYSIEQINEMTKCLKSQLGKSEAVILQPPKSNSSLEQLQAFKTLYLELSFRKHAFKQKLSILNESRIEEVNDWVPIVCIHQNSDEFPITMRLSDRIVSQERKSQKSFKQKLLTYLRVAQNVKDQSLANQESNPNRLSRNRKQTFCCFSRKKLKQFIEGSEYLCVSRPKIKSNALITLPLISQKNLKSLESLQIVRKDKTRHCSSGKQTRLKEKEKEKQSKNEIIKSIGLSKYRIIEEEQGALKGNKKLKGVNSNLPLKVPCNVVNF